MWLHGYITHGHGRVGMRSLHVDTAYHSFKQGSIENIPVIVGMLEASISTEFCLQSSLLVAWELKMLPKDFPDQIGVLLPIRPLS